MRLPSYSEYSATSSSKAGDDGWIVGFKIYRWGIGLSEENSFSAGYLSVVGNVAILVFFQSGRLCKQPESLQDMTHVIYMVLGSPILREPTIFCLCRKGAFWRIPEPPEHKHYTWGFNPGFRARVDIACNWLLHQHCLESLCPGARASFWLLPSGAQGEQDQRWGWPRPGVSSVGKTFFRDFSCWSWWVHRHSLEFGLPSQATKPPIFVAWEELVNNPGEELIVGISHLHATFQLDHAISGWEDQTCRTLKSVPKLRRTPLSRRFEREKF